MVCFLDHNKDYCFVFCLCCWWNWRERCRDTSLRLLRSTWVQSTKDWNYPEFLRTCHTQNSKIWSNTSWWEFVVNRTFSNYLGEMFIMNIRFHSSQLKVGLIIITIISHFARKKVYRSERQLRNLIRKVTTKGERSKRHPRNLIGKWRRDTTVSLQTKHFI